MEKEYRRLGSFDPSQHKGKEQYDKDPQFQALFNGSTPKMYGLTIGSNRCCSLPAPTSDQLHCFSTVTSHVGTFLSAIALVYLISPGLIILECDRHNGTQSFNCNPHLVIRDGSISGSVAFVLFMLMCAISAGYRWCSNNALSDNSEAQSLVAESPPVSCCAPNPALLQRFASQLGAFSLGAAVPLFTSLWIIIKASCNFLNNTDTDTGSNISGTYVCKINSLAERNSIFGAALLGLGLLMYAFALAAHMWGNSMVQSTSNDVDKPWVDSDKKQAFMSKHTYSQVS